MAQQDTILTKAISEIGTMEDKFRNVKYSADYGMPRVDWCVMFVWWVFNECNLLSVLGNKKTASCRTAYSFAQSNSMITNNPQKGDLAIFCWDGTNKPQHIGIVESVSATQVTTIDGNTTASGYARNCVARRTRSRNLVLAFVHPTYSDSVTTQTSTDVVDNTKTYTVNPNLDPVFVTITRRDIHTTSDLYKRTMEHLYALNLITYEESVAYDDFDTVTTWSSTTSTRDYVQRFILNPNYEYIHLMVYIVVTQGVKYFGYALITEPTIHTSFNWSTGLGTMTLRDANGNSMSYPSSTPMRYLLFKGNNVTWSIGGHTYNDRAFIALGVGSDNNRIGRIAVPDRSSTSGLMSLTLNAPFELSGLGNTYSYNMLKDIKYYQILDEQDLTGDGKMRIELWDNFSKRKNSTLQPEDGQVLECTLVENTSVLNPTVRLKSNNFTYNYFKLFGNYYYVTDCTCLRDGMIALTGKIDGLASCKSNIMNSTQFVERSETQYNENLDDNLVSSDNTWDSVQINLDPTGTNNPFSSTGCFSITVANDIVGATGSTSELGVTTYILDAVELSHLMRWINGSDPQETAVEEIAEYLIAQFGDCFSAILNCIYLPVNILFFGTGKTSEEIKIGKYFTRCYGFRFNQITNHTSDVFDMDISASLPSDFRKSSKYMQSKLFVPMYGYVDIDPTLLKKDLSVKISIDTIGECTFELLSKTPVTSTTYKTFPIVHLTYKIGVDLIISQNGKTLMGIIESGLTSATGIASSLIGASVGNVGAVASGAVETIKGGLGIVTSMISNGISTNGNCGGSSMLGQLQIFLYLIKSNLTIPTIFGKPLKTNISLSSLTGYCVCSGANVPNVAYPSVKQEIDMYLNSGVFLE